MTIGSLSPFATQQLPSALAPAGPSADPAAVQAFEAAMNTPPPPPKDVALATDKELASFSKSEIEQLRKQWGKDDAGMRRDAKVRLEIREKMIEGSILKIVKKYSDFD